MCGIIGIYGVEPVAERIYDALTILQHRGQDASGIITGDKKKGRIYQHKGNGLVRDVFDSSHIQHLYGDAGIGHVRYPTAGSSNPAEAQPFYVNAPYGIALAHNGNLINSDKLTHELFDQDLRHVNTDSDSEVLLNIFAHGLLHSRGLFEGPKEIFNAVEYVHRRCQGAYSVVALIANCGILAFRDPLGIRPLVYGERETKHGIEYMFASESVALSAAGFTLTRDVMPGESIYIDKNGRLHAHKCTHFTAYHTCIFEYVYFSRPDSVIDKVFVHKARMRMGSFLGQKLKKEWSEHNIDVVMPIPDTSRTAALELANELGVKYREGFIKNRYIGRTFIMPGQKQRHKSVRQKLNPLDIEFKNKNVLLVDDSIVRGTTSREIVHMARVAGAKKVYFASAAPPVCHPNIYGIDMPVYDELIAHNKTIDQVRDSIKADYLLYQDLDSLITAVREGNRNMKEFDCSVFDGKYAHELPEGYFENLALLRKDNSAMQRDGGLDLR